jgi:hypothetical protein
VADADITNRLDLLIGLLNFAFADQIERQRAQILADPVNSAVLEALSGGTMGAAALQAAVKSATKQSERTIVRRIADLIERGCVVRIGAGGAVQYRATGLIVAGRRAAISAETDG